jgi:DNA replication protein DnaC
MNSIGPVIQRLRVNPEHFFKVWLGASGVKSRLDSSGNSTKDGGLVTSVALAQTAIRFLKPDNESRKKVLEICQKVLATGATTGCPWTLRDQKDKVAAAYVTGHTLCDLGKNVESLVDTNLLGRALSGLESWLSEAIRDSQALEFPFIYRATLALATHGKASPELLAQAATHAQVIIHRSVSAQALGSPSQFNPNIVCLALAMDNAYSPNPMPQHEREKCLNIALKGHEPLITLRSTITTAGTAAVGCSALEVLRRMLASQPIANLLYHHEEQIQATLAWLEDHSTTVKVDGGEVRLFQSDLWPNYLAFEAWFNCLVLMFLDDLETHLNSQHQAELRKKFSATEPTSKFSFETAPCGGFTWPRQVKETFLKEVANQGKVDSLNGIVLFGPPGTGKTTLAKLIAKEIPTWQFVELSTADFLLDGPEGLYRSIRRIFQDLRQLEKCVVFFDELELLVQERGEDWAAALITNVMLPELQQLHDSRSIIPIFATNHVSRFDSAGRRPGRFDFILPVGLPSASERLTILKKHLKDRPPEYLYAGIESLSEGTTIRELLGWATQYAAGNPGKDEARKIWESGFSKLRAQDKVLRKFEEDIENYAYPPGVDTKA